LDARNVIAVDSQTYKANFYTHNYGLPAWHEREIESLPGSRRRILKV